MTLLIAMPGPVLPEAGFAAGDAGAWPELPALADLLHGARRLPSAPDWRSGVMGVLFAGGSAIPRVAVASRVLPGLAPDTPLCFAAPLHVVAGISRVHLPPGGRLQLDDGQRAAWAEAFNSEFGAADVRLHDVAGGWLLQAPFAVGALDADPADLAGQALAREPAATAHGRQLRRLGAEVEMWLADHPLNRLASRRQQLPVNCLWFWGGGLASRLPATMWQPREVVSTMPLDPWMAGVAAAASAEPVGRALRWSDQWRDALVVLAPGEVADHASWVGFESGWFAPVLRALRAGACDDLRLQVGATAWQVPARARWRWLRRRRAWHKLVDA